MGIKNVWRLVEQAGNIEEKAGRRSHPNPAVLSLLVGSVLVGIHLLALISNSSHISRQILPSTRTQGRADGVLTNHSMCGLTTGGKVRIGSVRT